MRWQVWANDPHHSREAREPQQRRVLAEGGYEGRADHDQVEHVPAAAEEVLRAAAVRGEAEQQLGHEDAEEDVVQQLQRAAGVAVDLLVGLEPKDRGVGQDHQGDEVGEGVRLDDAVAGLGERPLHLARKLLNLAVPAPFIRV